MLQSPFPWPAAGAMLPARSGCGGSGDQRGAGAGGTDGPRLTAKGDAGLLRGSRPRRVPRVPQSTRPRARAGGSPGARLRRKSQAPPARRALAALYSGCGRLRGRRRSGSGAARRASAPLLAPQPHPPGPGPEDAQPWRRGPLPCAARTVCFPCPTDVSQNIGHMFSGNKLGMSANTLGLRWLFQLPHGRLGGGEMPPCVGPDPK